MVVGRRTRAMVVGNSEVSKSGGYRESSRATGRTTLWKSW